jgi:hypothetical protein
MKVSNDALDRLIEEEEINQNSQLKMQSSLPEIITTSNTGNAKFSSWNN